jgi:hypothetical protein
MGFVSQKTAPPVLIFEGALGPPPTIDGKIEATGAVFEAKFMLPWNFSEEGLRKSTWRSCSTICG